MSKFTSAAIAAFMLSSSTYAFAQVADRSYYGGATVSSPSAGQYFVRNRYTAANAHSYPGLDPVPVRIGAFEARPVLLLGSRTRSNVFLTNTAEQSDTMIVIEPSISMASTWSRHRIGFDAAVEHEEFLDLSNQSATQYGVRGFGEVDVSSNFAVAGSVIHQNLREDRLSIGGQTGTTAAERIEFDRSGGEANALYATDRLRLQGRVSLTEYDYASSQNFRDHESVTVTGSAQYAITRDWAVIGEIETVDREYSATGSNRDISGITYRAGANFELPVNLRGQVTAQYQDFDPVVGGNIQQTGLSAAVQWFPSQLTTANFFASQSVSDAGNTADTNVAVTRYGVGLDHELLRTLVLTSQLSFENREFNPSNREDDQTVFNVGANWKLNPNVQIQGGYRFATQDSNVNPFDDHSVTIAIRFFP
ncbi:MAG: outer membrane beta-barrel protein [Hyphomonadaceae bacterium]|nr:outer membrane beta-barrel protein [Hyphomonadaceae bacterium]